MRVFSAILAGGRNVLGGAMIAGAVAGCASVPAARTSIVPTGKTPTETVDLRNLDPASVCGNSEITAFNLMTENHRDESIAMIRLTLEDVEQAPDATLEQKTLAKKGLSFLSDPFDESQQLLMDRIAFSKILKSCNAPKELQGVRVKGVQELAIE